MMGARMTGLGGAEADRLFQALGDPTRRAILDRLAAGPSSVSGLAGPLGITLTAVSQHLGVLEGCGLASTRKAGRVRTCSIEAAGFDRLQGWIDAHRASWDRRLDALGDLLAEED
ncbi:MAG: transcriptional regulator [Caulobacter sp.]|nr:transcriptional regulator [Caulobacter sp.]